MNIKLDIPESFFQGEERCGYYVSPEMKKVWAVQLDLLNEFARVCEKNNLRWYIDAGTLLGAVRHKGFIPWDHDADVMMMRSEYDRLCSIAPKEFQLPYTLCTYENSLMPKKFARLCNEDTAMFDTRELKVIASGYQIKRNAGICIDVFPVDKIPDDENKIRKIVRRLKIYSYFANKIYYWKDNYLPAVVSWRHYIKVFLHKILKHTSLNYKPLIAKFSTVARSYNQSDSKHAAKLCMAFDPKFIERRVWNLSDFDEVTYLPFEMLTLPAPSGWENILNKFYGDWHKFVIRETNGIPDPEAYFYDTEHPYTYYTQEGHIPNESNA